MPGEFDQVGVHLGVGVTVAIDQLIQHPFDAQGIDGSGQIRQGVAKTTRTTNADAIAGSARCLNCVQRFGQIGIDKDQFTRSHGAHQTVAGVAGLARCGEPEIGHQGLQLKAAESNDGDLMGAGHDVQKWFVTILGAPGI